MLTFVAAAWYSAQGTYADLLYQKNDTEALRRAVSLAPDNVVFRALLAEHLEGEGGDADPQFIEIKRLTPLDSQYLIRYAFQKEIEGSYGVAEQLLLDAARVDHKAAPRWALMNFYFRRERAAEFWAWVTRALEMSQDDVSAIFRLAWDRTDDAALILQHIPDRHDLLVSYLQFLADSGRLDVSGEVATRVAKRSTETELPVLLRYCDKYVDTDPERAVSVWNGMCQRKLIPYPGLNPSSGNVLTNADFTSETLRHGFDWRIRFPEDTLIGPAEGGGIRIDLGGNQPEDCVLMEQPIPLAAGTTYMLSWNSGSLSSDPVTGLLWDLDGDAPDPQHSAASVPGGAGSNPGIFVFAAKEKSARLRLRYKRPLGSVRAKGSVTIRGLRVTVQP